MNVIENVATLEKIARQTRIDIVKMIHAAKSGHPGGSLSAVEMLVGLYFNVLKHDPKNPSWEDRDRFILSKGHACPALYSVLAESGYIKKDLLMTLRKLESPLQGHLDRRFMPFLEASTGSLGQGLSIAIGYALAAKLDNKDYKTFVMLGDGETQEGQVWEGAMFASFHNLSNLVCIIDYNKIQLDGFVKDILDITPLEEKWKSFGWHTEAVDGNNMSETLNVLKKAKQNNTNKPFAIISNTIKGKGVSFMENTAAFHGKAPDDEQLQQALKELEV